MANDDTKQEQDNSNKKPSKKTNPLKSDTFLAALVAAVIAFGSDLMQELMKEPSNKKYLEVSDWKKFEPTWNIPNTHFDYSLKHYRIFGDELEIKIKAKITSTSENATQIMLRMPGEFPISNDRFISLFHGDVLWLSHRTGWYSLEAVNMKAGSAVSPDPFIVFKTDHLKKQTTNSVNDQLTYDKLGVNDYFLIHIFVPIDRK